MNPIGGFQRIVDFCGKVPVLNFAVGCAKIVKAGVNALHHLRQAHKEQNKVDAEGEGLEGMKWVNKKIQHDLNDLKYGLYTLIPVWGGIKAESLRKTDQSNENKAHIAELWSSADQSSDSQED